MLFWAATSPGAALGAFPSEGSTMDRRMRCEIGQLSEEVRAVSVTGTDLKTEG